MTKKGKAKEQELLAQQFEELLSQCFPSTDEPHMRRVASEKLGAQWAQQAIETLRERIAAGSTGSPPDPLQIPPLSMPLQHRQSERRQRSQPATARSNRPR